MLGCTAMSGFFIEAMPDAATAATLARFILALATGSSGVPAAASHTAAAMVASLIAFPARASAAFAFAVVIAFAPPYVKALNPDSKNRFCGILMPPKNSHPP